MPRRTVAIPAGFDRAIRSYQAKLMRLNNRDVTFTEALNYVLFRGFLSGPIIGGEIIAFWKEGAGEKLESGTQFFTEIKDPLASRPTTVASKEERMASDDDFHELMEGFNAERVMFEGSLDALPTGDEPDE